MRVRASAAVLAAVAMMVSGVTAAPATAAPVPVASASIDSDAADREFVEWLALYDEQAMVRAVAWNALVSDDVSAAIQLFFESEWDNALLLADGSRQRNKDFVAHVLATCVPEYAPEVCRAAQHAARGSDAARDLFVRSEYAAAKARDKRARDDSGQQAAAIVDSDRAFVARLRDDDPGPQVRAAAAWALRPGATDSDLVEFFAYGWTYSGGLDVRAHRSALAGAEASWRRTIRQLTADAEAAEAAARETGDEAARATAARAWATVGAQTGPARVAWSQAEEFARAQAESWHQIAAVAAAAEGPNWIPVADAAGGVRAQWEAEREQARIQAAYWTALIDRARAAERDLSAPPA